MNVGTLCTRMMASVSSQETIRAAAQRMSSHDVGTLAVLDRSDALEVIGILTDRDIVLRCVAPGLDPARTTVGAMMTRPVYTVSEHAPVEEALRLMAEAGTRRLLVLGDAARPVGVLRLDDLLDLVSEEVGDSERLLGKRQSGFAAAIGAG